MDSQAPHEKLNLEMKKLCLLNPDIPQLELDELFSLAEATDSEHFPGIATAVEDLIRAYLQTPSKTMSDLILREYFEYIEKSARLLTEAGEILKPETSSSLNNESVALVHREQLSSLDLCKVLNRAGIPRELTKAVDACRRRNELLTSVVEYGLVILQKVDTDKALRWELDYLEHRDGELDPDIVRDFLSAWLMLDDTPRKALRWAERWSADSHLGEQWPTVVLKADRLLTQHALRAWQENLSARNSSLAHIKLLVKNRRTGDDLLLGWLNAALIDVGESVRTFMALDGGTDGEPDPEKREWRSAAMLKEIERIEALFTPVMLTANLILSEPDGAYSFAVAFFGLVGKGRDEWQDRLLRLAQNAVRKAFLLAAKNKRNPMEIIERLTFGDTEAVNHLRGQLDWVTGRFDSIKQRELVGERLAYYYASYREPYLLSAEISRRYRNLMRLMHEDNLRRALLPEHFAQLQTSTIIRDLSAIASEARKFLNRRRALDNDLEEMVAAEMDFTTTIRQLRLRIVHRLLF